MLTTELQCSSWGSITHSHTPCKYSWQDSWQHTSAGSREVLGLYLTCGLQLHQRRCQSASVTILFGTQTAASYFPLLMSMDQHVKTTELTELITGGKKTVPGFQGQWCMWGGSSGWKNASKWLRYQSQGESCDETKGQMSGWFSMPKACCFSPQLEFK